MANPIPPTLCAVVFGCALTFGHTANAVDFDWTGAVDSNWLEPGNWTPAGPPTGGAGNFARFFTGTTNPAVISANVDDLQDVLFDNNGTVGLRQVNHTAGNANTTGWVRMGLTVGSGDAGVYNLSGTGAFSTSRLQIAENAGTSATFTIADTSTANLRESFLIGDVAGAVGNFTQTGGTFNFSTAAASNFAVNAGNNGTANLTFSGGTFRQSDVGNTEDQAGWNQFAAGGSSVTTVNVSGTALISLDTRTFLGRNGNATFNQTGGTVEIRRGEVNIADAGTSVYNLSGGTLRTLNINSLMTVGQWDNGNGTVNVSGTGLLDVAGRLVVAAGQDPVTTTGNIVQTGGTVNAGRQLLIGDSALANGTYNLDAGNVTFGTAVPAINGENGNFVMGNRGKGTLTMTGGSFRQADVDNVDNNGNWNHIGQNNGAVAVFNLSGGVASFDARVMMGSNAGSSGTVNQTGGTFEVRRHELIVGDGATGTYNISGGTLQTNRGINVGNWNNSVGNLNVSGTANVISNGNMVIGQSENNTFNASGTVTQTGGTVTIGENINFGQNSTGAAGVYNLGGGTLDLTGGNIQRGPGLSTFNMTDGVLLHVSSIIGNSLDNNFTQQGGVFEVGALDGAGSLSTVNGNFSLLAAGTLKFDITTGVADQLLVNGSVTLGGFLDLDQTLPLLPGSSFTLIANDDVDLVTGAFSNAPNGVTFTQEGNPYTVFYNAGDGNDVLIVPEPTVAGFLALALLSGGLFSRRRRKE